MQQRAAMGNRVWETKHTCLDSRRRTGLHLLVAFTERGVFFLQPLRFLDDARVLVTNGVLPYTEHQASGHHPTGVRKLTNLA